MKAIVAVGVGEVMTIWIIPTYKPFGICLLRAGNGGAGAGYVVCLGFAV